MALWNRKSVSICIPTFNQSGYLMEAIESILNQTAAANEIIVSDDASTDETERIMAGIVSKYPNVRYIRQPINLGIAGNTNAALRLAQGEFVVRLDSDDRLLPDYVSILSRELAIHENAGYAHADVWEIDGAGNRLNRRTLARARGFQTADDALVAALKGYRVTANVIMFRRQALEALNYTANRPNYVEDYSLSVAMAREGWGNIYVDKDLAEYRVWLDKKGFRAKRKAMELKGIIRTFEEEINPGFSERGWDFSEIQKARRRQAIVHALALTNSGLSRAENDELGDLLRKLGASAALELQIFLIRLGLGLLVRAGFGGIAAMKRLVKNAARLSRSGIGGMSQ